MTAISPRPCPACEGSRDLAFVEERRDPVGGVTYKLYRCGTCALVFSEPRDPVGPDWYARSSPLRASEERPEPASDARFAFFLDADVPAGKVLDIGCGDGGFLSLAKAKGWDAAGVEHDARMVELARAKGIDAKAQDFEPYLKSRAAKEFAAVTLFDVLEHAAEPRDLVALIKPALRRGGHLAITVPNDARPTLFGREDYDYPPHHFTRWTPASLRGLLEREGFSVVELRTPGPSARWFSEMLFFHWIAPAALGLARRVLFGRAAGGTISSLYDAAPDGAPTAPPAGLKGFLSDPLRRRRLSDAFKRACRVLTWPLGALFSVPFRLSPGRGEHLYVLARYEG